MIIRIKKRKLIQLLVFLMVVIPLVYATTGPVTQQFMVYLTMANRPPVIHWVNTTAAIDPVDSGNVVIVLLFNVTDPDGYADINASSADMSINDSNFIVNATQCWSVENDSNWGYYNCSITMKYWYNASGYTINATILDENGSIAINASETFTYNELSAMSLPSTVVNFTGVNIGDENASAATNPFLLNNTGNDDFDLVNISASALRGMIDLGVNLNVENISINWSANTDTALAMINTSNQTLTNAVLKHGEPPLSNMSINFYITLPSDSGLRPQDYNATKKWSITVTDLP